MNDAAPISINRLPFRPGFSTQRKKGALIELAQCARDVFEARWDIAADLAVSKNSSFTLYDFCSEDGHVTHCRVYFEGYDSSDALWLCPRVFQLANERPYLQYSISPPGSRMPLFGLQHLNPKKPLLIVPDEASQTAAVASGVFNAHCVIAWVSDNPRLTVWAPIENWPKTVTIWLDGTEACKTRTMPVFDRLKKLGINDIRVFEATRVTGKTLFVVEAVANSGLHLPVCQALMRATPLQEWIVEDLESICLLAAAGSSMNPRQSCEEQWNRDEVKDDPYCLGRSYPPETTEFGEEFEINGRWPIGNAICNRCPVAGLGESAAAIAALTPILRQYVFVTGLDRFIDLRSGMQLKKSALNSAYYAQHRKPSAADLILSRPENICDGVINAYGYRRIIETENGRLFNMWRGADESPVKLPDEGEPHHFLKIASLCMPDPEARDVVLDFIAYMIQRPRAPVLWMPIISGGQGSGKDSLLKPLQAVLGISNMAHVTQHMIKDTFNEFLLARLIVLQEIERGNWDLYQQLKAKITNNVFSVNTKGLNRYTVQHKPSLICLTNDENPIPIETDDRRVFFYRSPLTRQILNESHDAMAAFNAFYDAETGYMSELPEFVRWCLDRDLSKFDPMAPPSNQWKRQAARDAMPAITQEVLEAMEMGLIRQPLISGLVLAGIMAEANDGKKVHPAIMGKSLGSVAIERVGRLLDPEGKRPLIYRISKHTLQEFCPDVSDDFRHRVLEMEKLWMKRRTLAAKDHVMTAFIQW